jgi:outer membrane protein OmpA-like peptidoglycan-associated protein
MIIKNTKVVACLYTVFLMTGCATSVSQLSADGRVEKVIFPDQSRAWIKGGVFASVDQIRKVQPNTTKDQTFALLGAPHFDEGFGRVREWDYVLNFPSEEQGSDNQNQGGGNQNMVQHCQFKIIFNNKMLVQETFWKPEDCATHLEKTSAPPETVGPDMMVAEKIIERTVEKNINTYSFKMDSDGFFDFDKYEFNDLRPGGKERLDKLVATIADKGQIVSLTIVGHTDRLGSDDYNYKLSDLRANTIKLYLVSQGIPADIITAHGVGKTMPIVQCNQGKRDNALSSCLGPNRRFEIDVELQKTI